MPDSTLVTTVRTRADAQSRFAAWHVEMNRIATDFPGFISLELRPQQKKECIEWTTVQRFRSNEELNAWRISAKRVQLLEEIKPFLVNGQKSITDKVEENFSGSGGVTEVFVTQVAPENYDLYRKWAFEIQQIEAQFPGYQGIYIQPPDREKGGSWITILHFDTAQHLEAWLSSDERKQLLKESELIVKELQSHRVVSPFSGWFAELSGKSGGPLPVWQQTMLVLLVLFPIVMLELRFLNPLLKGLNSSLMTFIGNAISVTLVSWPMIPLAIRFLYWWLVPGPGRPIQKLIVGTLVVIGLYILEIALFWNLL